MSIGNIEANNCSGGITSRGKLRTAFFDDQKKEDRNYISDLEGTLMINKTIIKDLLDAQLKESDKKKSLLQKLNDETLILQKSIKEFKNKYENEKSRNLILEQLIEELKLKTQEQFNELKEKNAELVEQLKLKEYYLQVFEKKCNDAEYLILKYLRTIPEASDVLEEINAPIKKGAISNVIVQNSELRKKIKELNNEVNALKQQTSIEEIKRIKQNLRAKINELTEENVNQREKLEKETKMNKELYELNEKLSSQLKNLNDQISSLMHSTKIVQTESNLHKSKCYSSVNFRWRITDSNR